MKMYFYYLTENGFLIAKGKSKKVRVIKWMNAV